MGQLGKPLFRRDVTDVSLTEGSINHSWWTDASANPGKTHRLGPGEFRYHFFHWGFHVGNRVVGLGISEPSTFHRRFLNHPQLPNPQPSPKPPKKKIHFARCWLIPMGFFPKVSTPKFLSSLFFRPRLFLVRSDTLRFSRISMAGFLMDFSMAS